MLYIGHTKAQPIYLRIFPGIMQFYYCLAVNLLVTYAWAHCSLPTARHMLPGIGQNDDVDYIMIMQKFHFLSKMFPAFKFLMTASTAHMG